MATMKPNEIRASLMLAEVKIVSIANELKVSESLVHKVINNERPNERVRKAIADKISKPVDRVFPRREAV